MRAWSAPGLPGEDWFPTAHDTHGAPVSGVAGAGYGVAASAEGRVALTRAARAARVMTRVCQALKCKRRPGRGAS